MTVRLAQQGDGNGICAAQKRSKHCAFLGIEIRKAIKKNIFPVNVVRLFQAFTKLGQLVPGIQTGTAEPLLVGRKQKAQIAKLGSGGALNGAGGFIEGLRGHFIAAQFIKKA